ncbi:hypothetical protein KK062_08755 [Fulvivirgaceae bacterium PWU5]|uniref:START domain-containing protein n=1 Tax=Dawidia cretensis TaxID=2782350 RepID=A0AAP2GV20_9BACT|nr:hypothetical protein [Dawidia cretensis]MBT1708312.1 hypothetical protein [Dawidia cretensis]
MKMYVWVFCSFMALATKAQDDEGFELVKKDGDISIYERWITFSKVSPPVEAREVKGEFFFNNTVYEGLRIIQDQTLVEQWQSHVSEFKIYKQRDTTTWFEYSYHDIPWPVADQDSYLIYRLSFPGPGILFIAFESHVDATRAPVRKGVTRLELAGSWRLERLTPGRTKATYRILSKPGNIPKFITDPIIRNNMMTTIREYIALLEDPSRYNKK